MFIAEHLQKMGKLRRSEMFINEHFAPTELGLSSVAKSYKHFAPTELNAVSRLCRTDVTYFRSLRLLTSGERKRIFVSVPPRMSEDSESKDRSKLRPDVVSFPAGDAAQERQPARIE